jgi:hypothetical protein
MPLVLTMMLSVALAALASAMAVATATEVLIAGAYRDGAALLYAADAAAEFALEELSRSDWNHVLDTGGPSTFVDGTPPDSRILEGPDGHAVYAYGRFGNLLGREAVGTDPYVIVWIADLTEMWGAGEAAGRVAGLRATALGPAGGRRTLTLTARLASADEQISVERLSWAQEP